MATAVLLGTLDTKGREYAFLADRIREAGVDVLLVDAGVQGSPQVAPDIDRNEVAAAVGHDVAGLAAAGDRGAAMAVMAEGAACVVARLHDQGRLDGLLGLGGSGGTSIVARAMTRLPVGVPKLIVSTVASGNTRPYVGGADIAMLHSVVDISGINRVSRVVLSNAAGAMAGMIIAPRPDDGPTGRPLIATTMFGVTTPAVETARDRLEAHGCEVLTFHATGTGGDSMESLVREGSLAGVLDITTTELCDLLVGGALASSESRLSAAGEMGVPQVVSLGALDMVNFGPMDSVPRQFRHRTLLQHNADVTLMRTSVEECAQLGKMVSERLNGARGPTALFLPLRGVSSVSVPGQPFHDPEADAALFATIRKHVNPDVVAVHEVDTHINDPEFASAMAATLHDYLQG